MRAAHSCRYENCEPSDRDVTVLFGVHNQTALNEAMQAVALERDARCASPSTQSAASLSAELSKFGEAAVAENVDVAWRSGAIATTTAEVSSSSPRCCHEPFQTWCPRSWR